jgi:hypothetical protein
MTKQEKDVLLKLRSLRTDTNPPEEWISLSVEKEVLNKRVRTGGLPQKRYLSRRIAHNALRGRRTVSVCTALKCAKRGRFAYFALKLALLGTATGLHRSINQKAVASGNCQCQMKQEAILIRARLKPPRVAAVAGILFSVLLITGLLLFRIDWILLVFPL